MGALGNRAEKYTPDEPESSSDFGGPEEIRTLDPYNANVVRSQLRYRPECSEIDDCRFTAQLLYSISAQKATT